MRQHNFKIGWFAAITLLMVNCAGNQSSQEAVVDSISIQENDEVKVADAKKEPSAKPKKYTWQFEMCEYTGIYDANQCTKEQFDNTIEWLLLGRGTTTSLSIFNMQDVESINQNAIEEEFAESLQQLNTLKFVNTPFFIELKQKRIEEIARLKLLTLMQIASYKNPEVLNSDSYSKNNCGKYTRALIEGGAALLAVWKEMAEKSRDGGNSNAWERYTNEFNSDHKLDHACVSVTTFGWWNCVNESIERPDGYIAHEEQFIKLFSDVKKTCEEP